MGPLSSRPSPLPDPRSSLSSLHSSRHGHYLGDAPCSPLPPSGTPLTLSSQHPPGCQGRCCKQYQLNERISHPGHRNHSRPGWDCCLPPGLSFDKHKIAKAFFLGFLQICSVKSLMLRSFSNQTIMLVLPSSRSARSHYAFFEMLFPHLISLKC